MPIAGQFGSRQAVSKHILDEFGAVNQEQCGRKIYYQLNIDKMKEIDLWTEAFRKLWKTRFDRLDNL